jgi:MFS family permease
VVEITYTSLSVLLLIATIGQIMADVMADALVVERSKFEPEERRGQQQASCYAIRFAGSMVGSVLGALVYNKSTWGFGMSFQAVCMSVGLLPVVCFFPLVYFLWEQRGLGANSVSNQLHDIWQMMQLRAVWRPMIFIFTYNIFQVPNVAWSSFLQLGLGFPAWSIGTMNVAGAVMTFLGILAYKRYFFETSWRVIC